MTARISDRAAMIRGMTPQLRPGTWHFCTLPDGHPGGGALRAAAVATIREVEGLSLILATDVADRAGLSSDQPMVMISLAVHSALDGVGLTAAVAGALAERGIACNMVAGHHHDHAFVPAADADRSIACLRALAEAGA